MRKGMLMSILRRREHSSSSSPYIRDYVYAKRKEDRVEITEDWVKSTRRTFTQSSSFAGAAGDSEGCDLINPDGYVPEIAFSGRSNVGKSSLLNALVGSGTMARVSGKPGHTRGVNFFALGSTEAFLVDLPGYGFAKVGSKKDRKVVEDRAIGYAVGRDRNVLRKVFVLIDSRRGLMPIDREVLKRFDKYGTDATLVLTKIDTLKSETALRHVLNSVGSELENFTCLDAYVHFISVHKNLGIEPLRMSIARAVNPLLGFDG